MFENDAEKRFPLKLSYILSYFTYTVMYKENMKTMSAVAVYFGMIFFIGIKNPFFHSS